jgi:uncharacterized membrane protein YfcA
VGLPALPVHTVTGVTMLQVAAAALAGVAGHARQGPVRLDLVATLGGGMIAGALTGAFLSRWVTAPALVAVFAWLAVVAAVAMFLPARWMPSDEPAAPFRLRRGLAVGAGLVTGVLVGLVGAGGGFLLVPLMLYVLRIPLRTSVAASLAIVLLSGLAGLTGKVATGQVDWHIGLALVSGALPGAWAGAAVSARTHTRRLGRLLGVILALVAIRMWWAILM